MYADKITPSMKRVIDETNRRRGVAAESITKEHGITPQTISKELKPLVDPHLISNKAVSFDDEYLQGGHSIEVIRGGRMDGIHYKANPAMKEVIFDSKEKFLRLSAGSHE